MKSWVDIVNTSKPNSAQLVSNNLYYNKNEDPTEKAHREYYAIMMKENPFLWNDITEQYRKKVNSINLKIKDLEKRIETSILDKIEEKSIMTQIAKLRLEKPKLLPFCVIASIDGKTRAECFDYPRFKKEEINGRELFPFHQSPDRHIQMEMDSSTAVFGAELDKNKFGIYYDVNEKKKFINRKNKWTDLI